jgi:hypothetical protein
MYSSRVFKRLAIFGGYQCPQPDRIGEVERERERKGSEWNRCHHRWFPFNIQARGSDMIRCHHRWVPLTVQTTTTRGRPWMQQPKGAGRNAGARGSGVSSDEQPKRPMHSNRCAPGPSVLVSPAPRWVAQPPWVGVQSVRGLSRRLCQPDLGPPLLRLQLRLLLRLLVLLRLLTCHPSRLMQKL